MIKVYFINFLDHSCLQEETLDDGHVNWRWELEPDGEFTVRSLRYHLDSQSLPSVRVASKWNNFVSIKVNIMVWRLALDRLPTRLNLERRGIYIPSVTCPVCDSDVESIEHLFLACETAFQIWKGVWRWLHIDMPFILNVIDFWKWVNGLKLASSKKEVVVLVCMTTF